MKRYRMLIVYETQRNKLYQIHNIWAENEQIAGWLAIGILMEEEHREKDRYLKITGVFRLSDNATQEEIAMYL